MPTSTLRKLLGVGTLIAIVCPVFLNVFPRSRQDPVEVVQELASAGPFEVRQDGQVGRPVSAVSQGGTFAWTYHYCLITPEPATETLELRSVIYQTAILRITGQVVSGPDRCLQGSQTLQVPIDARIGFYVVARRVAVTLADGASVSTPLSSIPIEVIP